MTKSYNHPASKACNINATGKAVRLFGGLSLTIVAITLAIFVMTNQLPASYGWWLTGITFISGIVLIYEGWAGWCVVRAMGIQTPL